MNIGVLGLWHLGPVTAAGLAALGHCVIAIDFDESRVARLRRGIAPVFEPGLEPLIERGLASANLRFSAAADDLKDVELLWITYDTPVDADDHADVEFVMAQIERALPAAGADVMVLISSQLPVGSVSRLERSQALRHTDRPPRIAYSPENLRLGSAVDDFLRPNRIVAGVRSTRDKELLNAVFATIAESVEWMSVESAEMTKHAINAFFATSVAFANEVAALCESVGADAKDVERGLKTDARIGRRAYLAPGAAFSGGTLARDLAFLEGVARERGVTTPLLSAVLPSNEAHRRWAQRRLRELFGDLSCTTIAVWGLTYKPGTDTLRRSLSVELCDWLVAEGAAVHVHDPAVRSLPVRWGTAIQRYDDPLAALQGAHALVVATGWPLYREISIEQAGIGADRLIVLDAARYLPEWAGAGGRIEYFAVGMSPKRPPE